ncbi:hypothetical protein [Sphingomonas profundi]|uniref:hypothetical protein n=1 Tax=Alterirhizorhabdus profundi TaxID=2681549 RepID=UPI0012E7C2CE|nr:hypothetical protein [Sphingomonas profundi]
MLGRPRPRIDTASQMPRRKKKGSRRVVVRLPSSPAPMPLAPAIEARVALRERWSHKQGTAETHDHAERRRSGSLARLFESGALDKDQLAAAEQIGEAYRIIVADVAVRTASLEARVDGGVHGRLEEERLGRIQAERAYDSWRDTIARFADPLLDIIVHDVGLTIAARRHGLSMPRARRLLTVALDLWWTCLARERRAA